jgi:zinc transport system ATP-binding protein
LPYRRGQILFKCGHDHTRPQPAHVGYVPQRLNIDPRLPITVRDLLGLALKRAPIFLGFGRAIDHRMRTLLAQVDAEELLDRPVDGLSGGQLQRVLLALALDPRPELLLLDEPASGIDFKKQQSFYQLISDLNRRTEVTILLVSHDVTMVGRMADRGLCLKDGVIHHQGPPQQVITPETLAEVFGPELGFFAHRHDH